MKADRRSLLVFAGAGLLAPFTGRSLAQVPEKTGMPSSSPKVTLLTAPIELAGNWGKMIPRSADKVVELMRASCLEGVRLVSDRQPARLRVDEHPSGPPAVWLHSAPATTAWVIVDIGERAWSQLAYQFGHELGHVLGNSWGVDAKPGPPCQWIEEALVEAFSLRGLGILGRRWKEAPPFAGDNNYGDAILKYRQKIVEKDRQLAAQQGASTDLAGWLQSRRSDIERSGVLPYGQVAASLLLAEYERTPSCVEAIGALNRWPARTHLPVADYLHAWRASCHQLGASPTLPNYLLQSLKLS